MKSLLPLLLFCCFGLAANAQFTKDAVVPIYVTVDPGVPQVHLEWLTPVAIHDAILFRREKDADTWFVLLQTAQSTVHTFTDTNVEVGKTYEYGVQRLANGIYAFGYATVPIMAPAVHQRGALAVIVEAALKAPLQMELERLRQDLIGDGWTVHWHSVEDTVSTDDIKSLINGYYNNGELKAAFLLGDLPVPYSGNSAWDGHTNHQGAWPADTWYGDLDGNWTDVSVNNTTPSRPENDNIPGDGKFDQSFIPSALEVAIGRVDFSNLSESTFGTTRIELYRRYLDKNHRWRNKLYTVSNKVLIDDNFGYFGGEAFAANGWRNGYAIVGVDSVMDGDFFNDTDTSSFLVGYGCGGGTYTSASGVGNSTQFATDSVNIVFSMLFGSFHGDWDYSPNPFMVSALASRGGILSCSWAGRPHWFYHHLGAGETLAYCALASQNACYNNGYFNSFGNCGAHMALLGDPSLRAQIVALPEALTANNRCASVLLSWQAPAASDVEGFFVYRSTSADGPFEVLNAGPITSTVYEDNNAPEDTLYYMVKTVVLENTATGIFYNTSTGRTVQTIFAKQTPPSANPTQGATITCAEPAVILEANPASSDYLLLWEGPGGTISEEEAISVSEAGVYTLTLTDTATGCQSVYQSLVTVDTIAPTINIIGEVLISCTLPVILLQCPTPDLTCLLIQPNGDTITLPATIGLGGNYELVLVSNANGCSSKAGFVVAEDFTPPALAIEGDPVIYCEDTYLEAKTSNPGDQLFWSGPGISEPTKPGQLITSPGTYTVIATGPNGCTATEVVEVEKPYTPLVLPSGIEEALDCAGNIVNVFFDISGGLPPYSFIIAPQPPIAPGQGYAIEVVDANGCTLTAQGLNNHQPTWPALSLSSTPETNSGSSDGTATATVSGGSPPFTYNWSNGQTTPTATNLAAGEYTVTVTGSDGCETVDTAAVELLNATRDLPGLLYFGLRPNPASDVVTVALQLDKPLEIELDILDVLGRVWHSAPIIRSSAPSWTLDIGQLPAGVYFVKVKSGAHVAARRLVVE